MNLSPARLAVLVALVVGGVAIILNGFGDDDAVLGRHRGRGADGVGIGVAVRLGITIGERERPTRA